MRARAASVISVREDTHPRSSNRRSATYTEAKLNDKSPPLRDSISYTISYP